MTRTYYIFIWIALLLSSDAIAQTEEVKYILSFDMNKKEINEAVKNEIDSMYDLLPRGNTLVFDLISKKERKKGEKYYYELSRLRANEVIAYLQKKKIATQYIHPITEQEGKSKKSSMSNAGYRDFVKTAGIYLVAVVKPDTYKTPYTYSDSLFTLSGVQEFSINAGQLQIVYGNSGTSLVIPKNAFLPREGVEPVCDNISLKLIEVYDYSSMLLNGLLTTSNYHQLETGGMIYIEANCNEEILRLAPNKKITICFPVQNTSDKKKKEMQLFKGAMQDNNMVNWLPDPNAKEGVDNVDNGLIVAESMLMRGEGEGGGEENSELDTYIFKTSKLGWINCDRFYDVKDKTDLLVNIPDENNIAVRLVFQDIKSIMPAYDYSPGKKVKFSDVPSGKKATIIAYAKKGSQFLYASALVVLGETIAETLNMQLISEDEFKQRLKQLD